MAGKLTVERNKQRDGAIRSPSLDFTDIGGEDGVVHRTVEYFASRRHGCREISRGQNQREGRGEKAAPPREVNDCNSV